MIEVKDVVKKHDKLQVLNGVSLSVPKGKIAVIIGPSGGGKSTLLRCINGLETFEYGEIKVGELCLKADSEEKNRSETLQQLRRRVNMVFQQFHLFPHMTVLDNVLAGPLYVLGEKRSKAESEAERLLQRVGLGDKLYAWPENLSGGQQQRVAIARSLAMRPEAILFDEPTSALDPKMSREVLAVITDLAREGEREGERDPRTMIIVTHAMGFARRVADTVHVMANVKTDDNKDCGGKIVESGAPEQIFEHPQDPATRSFLSQLMTA